MLRCAIDSKLRRFRAGVQSTVAELLKQGRIALWQVRIQEPIPFVLPIGRLERYARNHVSPAGRLGDHRRCHRIGQAFVTGHCCGGCHSPIVEQIRMRAIGKSHLEFSVLAEPVVRLGRVIGVGSANACHVAPWITNPRQPKGHFCVPRKELETRTGRPLQPGRIPVVARPIGVADIQVQQHVINVTRHIEEAFRRGIIGAVGIVSLHPLIGRRAAALEVEIHQVVPRLHVAGTDRFACVYGIPVLFVAAQITGRKRRIGTLHRVVHSPVHAVDVQMDEITV